MDSGAAGNEAIGAWELPGRGGCHRDFDPALCYLVPLPHAEMWTKGVEMSALVLHFVHGEAELAAVTGFREKKLREVRSRHLRQGEHWMIEGLRVAYTAAGAQLVIEALLGRELAAEELSAALEGSRLTAPKKAAAPIVAKVVKMWPNPWLLTVELPGGRPVNIRVRSSKNFRRGMECPVRVNDQGNYELARQRLPRFPGKW